MLGKIANFVVNSRLRSARNFIFSGKYPVTKFATSPSGGTLEETIELHETQRNRIKNFNNITTKTKNNEKTTQIITSFFYVDKLSQKLFTRI